MKYTCVEFETLAYLPPIPDELLAPQSTLINTKLTNFLQECEFRLQKQIAVEKDKSLAKEAALEARQKQMAADLQLEQARVKATQEGLTIQQNLVQAEAKQLKKEREEQAVLFSLMIQKKGVATHTKRMAILGSDTTTE